MDAHVRILVLCLDILRWSGLSFTRIKSTPDGHLIASHSKFHLLLNLTISIAFLYLFSQFNFSFPHPTEEIYRSSMIVYFLYTKIMAFTIVAFSFCGNVYNRKFVDIVNYFRRVTRELEREIGSGPSRKGKNGTRILVRFIVYIGVFAGLNLWFDAHIRFHFSRLFRVVHYVCFYYVTTFTAHFVVTMNCMRETWWYVNGALGRVMHPRERGRSGVWVRRRIRVWMETLLEVREMEDLVNEVFGKQIFLTLLLVFSSVIVNVYYIVSLNLYGTTYAWLNATMFVGFFQSIMVAVASTRAAEMAMREANRVNEVLIGFSREWNNLQMHNRMMYFSLFNHYYPMEFRAWVFYPINNHSLFKVIITSAAVTIIILQCDFLRGSIIQSQ